MRRRRVDVLLHKLGLVCFGAWQPKILHEVGIKVLMPEANAPAMPTEYRRTMAVLCSSKRKQQSKKCFWHKDIRARVQRSRQSAITVVVCGSLASESTLFFVSNTKSRRLNDWLTFLAYLHTHKPPSHVNSFLGTVVKINYFLVKLLFVSSTFTLRPAYS